MPDNISGQGLRVTLRASNTFPIGISLTQFADDADPLDTPSQQIADVGMGLNGDMVHWATTNAIRATLNMIPNSEDDRNLALLLEANRVGKGKRSARDIITMVISYPDGSNTTLNKGIITDGIPAKGVASVGRLKTRPYAFAFENKVEA